MSFYTGMRKIFAGPVLAIFRVRLHKTENIPSKGGLLVCPNHISAVDPVILAAGMSNRQLRFMAKAELFKIPVISAFIKAFGAFPIKRGAGDIGAIKNTVSLLKNNESVGMFIQGTRCSGVAPGRTQCRHGAGLITYRSGCDVLPVVIKTKNYKFRLFRRIDITFGEVMKYGDFGFQSGSKEEVTSCAEKIFARITELSEVEYN